MIVPQQRWRAHCTNCGSMSLVVVPRERKATGRGLLAVAGCLLSFVLLFTSPVAALVVFIIAVILGVTDNRKYSALMCAACGECAREL